MEAWEKFLQQQELAIGQETVQKWLRTLKIQRFDSCNLYLEAGDSFQANWFEEHVRKKVEKSLVNGNQKKIHVHLSIAKERKIKREQGPSKIDKNKQIEEVKAPSFNLDFDSLDPLSLFSYFIPSEENLITLQLLDDIRFERTPLGLYSPLFIHGPTGSGKTHLLMSLAHHFRSLGKNCIYVGAEAFTDHVVSAIRAGEMSRFRQAYRNTDILIVDDVDIFSRKGATQEEFFHTFNTIHLDGKQIILSANCPPSELQMIEPRLISRFEWGLVLPLRPLPLEEWKKVLEIKTNALHFHLPARISEFLLETFVSSPKTLIKAFQTLVVRVHLDSPNSMQHISLEIVRKILEDMLIEEKNSALTPARIIQTVAEHYGIRVDDILGESKKKECALPRQIAMYFCRERLKMPFMKIGDLFSRNHSTVISSIKFIQKSIDENHQDICNTWQTIAKKI